MSTQYVSQEALSRFDQTVCELIKRRNAMQYTARGRQKQLELLQKELAHMKMETEAIATTPAGESTNAKRLRVLENQLDRAIIQCNEANQIRKVYKGILEKMQLVSVVSESSILSCVQERLNYDNEVSDLKKGVTIRMKNLDGLHTMNNDAESAREMTRVSSN